LLQIKTADSNIVLKIEQLKENEAITYRGSSANPTKNNLTPILCDAQIDQLKGKFTVKSP